MKRKTTEINIRSHAADNKNALKPKCGLCGKTVKLTRTPCCDQLICDDASNYVLFSYSRNSCYRNHIRYTLCGYHYTERHEGDWLTCKKCREAFETEMYVYFGTNEYNFHKLENPPKYKPTRCCTCKQIIRLGEGGFSIKGGKYYCEKCSSI